jgi:hypothetical protein
MTTYEMKSASYSEYRQFCASESIEPVSSEAFTWPFWLGFCNAHGIKHSAISTEGN